MSDLRRKLLNSGSTRATATFMSGLVAKAETLPLTFHSGLSSGGSLENPFNAIFAEIRKANKAGLAHAALALTLTIPDICCALISSKGKSGSEPYAAWFDSHMKDYMGHLPGKDVYQLRCGFLHEARSDRPYMQWERVIFGTDGNHRISIKGLAVNGALQPDTFVVNVHRFGEEMIVAAESWFQENRDDPSVIKNAAHVVRHRKNVLAPGIGGIDGIC